MRLAKSAAMNRAPDTIVPASTLVQMVGRFEKRARRTYARGRERAVRLRADALSPMTAHAQSPCRHRWCGTPAAALPTCRFRPRDTDNTDGVSAPRLSPPAV